MSSSAKPELNSGSQLRQRRTDRATSTIYLHGKFSVIRLSSFRDKRVERQTNRHTHHNTLHPSRGRNDNQHFTFSVLCFVLSSAGAVNKYIPILSLHWRRPWSPLLVTEFLLSTGALLRVGGVPPALFRGLYPLNEFVEYQ